MQPSFNTVSIKNHNNTEERYTWLDNGMLTLLHWTESETSCHSNQSMKIKRQIVTTYAISLYIYLSTFATTHLCSRNNKICFTKSHQECFQSSPLFLHVHTLKLFSMKQDNQRSHIIYEASLWIDQIWFSRSSVFISRKVTKCFRHFHSVCDTKFLSNSLSHSRQTRGTPDYVRMMAWA